MHIANSLLQHTEHYVPKVFVVVRSIKINKQVCLVCLMWDYVYDFIPTTEILQGGPNRWIHSKWCYGYLSVYHMNLGKPRDQAWWARSLSARSKLASSLLQDQKLFQLCRSTLLEWERISPKMFDKEKMANFSGHIFEQSNICQKGLCGQDRLFGMAFQLNKWLVPGIAGMGGVLVRI